jgi:hypothetical protein
VVLRRGRDFTTAGGRFQMPEKGLFRIPNRAI